MSKEFREWDGRVQEAKRAEQERRRNEWDDEWVKMHAPFDAARNQALSEARDAARRRALDGALDDGKSASLFRTLCEAARDVKSLQDELDEARDAASRFAAERDMLAARLAASEAEVGRLNALVANQTTRASSSAALEH